MRQRGSGAGEGYTVITQTGQYALRAVVYLAEAHRNTNVTAAHVAEEVGLPQNYLSKILNALAHAGVLDSTRGPHGGFRLTRSADELTLADVLEPFEDLSTAACILSRTGCPHRAVCRSRQRCQTLSAEIGGFLRTTRIAGLMRQRDVERPAAGFGE